MPKPMTDREYRVDTKTDGALTTQLHQFTTDDGVTISLSHLPHARATDSVLLIHGLTTSSDMFVMPEHYNLAAFLHDAGFDVWIADYRMSNHYPYNHAEKFSFDDVGLYDWPASVARIRQHNGGRRLHVVAHCLGSATFHIALYGLKVSGVSSVVSNSISLNPRVHALSTLKLIAAPFLVDKVLKLPYIDPGWADRNNLRAPLLGRVIARVVDEFHLECDERACNLISFTWGTGHPAIWEHRNVHPITHARSSELFGAVGMEYFRNVRKCVLADNTLVRYKTGGKYDTLPRRYIDNALSVKVPTLLMSGEHNNIFPGANKLTHERVRAMGATTFRYREFAGYGHQDLVMGKSCAEDVFPVILDFLKQNAVA